MDFRDFPTVSATPSRLAADARATARYVRRLAGKRALPAGLRTMLEQIPAEVRAVRGALWPVLDGVKGILDAVFRAFKACHKLQSQAEKKSWRAGGGRNPVEMLQGKDP